MRLLGALPVALLASAIATAPGSAVSIAERTQRASIPASGEAAGASGRPSISPAGTAVAFESEAANLAPDANGPVKDVFLRTLGAGGTTALLSRAADGGAADGPSGSPVAAGNGVVVFASEASNLVEGDTNRATDIFIHRPGAPLERVSATAAGGQADGPSFEPDVSRDGRFVVFTSRATNLVPGDRNGVEDVFVRDLRDRTTRRLSQRGAAEAAGRSRAPAISPDGTFASFESTAANLVSRDTNRVPDVFLADLRRGGLRRVSVSSRERQQDRAVVPPFVMVSDVSDGGRYVAFDSDASNLVRGDRRDTDVFVRDVRRGTTELASKGITGRQGDNDSYFPSISRDGRFVAFTSFAGNLWPRDPRGEDLYVHDRRASSSTIVTVASNGAVRQAETSSQLLRRASMSDGARAVAFASTAPLGAGDRDRLQDVYVRNLSPPEGRVVSGPRGTIRTRRPRLRLAADDPAATFVCRLDGRSYVCPRSGRLPALRRGRHRLVVRATGPGMLTDPTPVTLVFSVR